MAGGILDGWQGFSSGIGGILSGLGDRLNSAWDNPAFTGGIALLGARRGEEDKAIQNMLATMMAQRMFQSQRDDKKKADERDARDFAFRQQEAARQGQQWQTQFQHQQAEAARAQANADRGFGFQQTEAQRAQGNTERNFGLQERGLNARAVPEGFEMDPEKPGALRPRAGGPADPNYKRAVGDRQNAPAGYVWNDPNNPSAGMRAIPGGPAEKVDAEVAARLGLANSFLGQLPDIRAKIDQGGLSGVIDGTMGKLGFGEPAELMRRIESGIDALLRNLTGAGMNVAEATAYANRYKPAWNDSADTIRSKVDQLERELRSVGDVVGRGRGGSVINVQPNSAINPGGALARQGGMPTITREQYDKLPSGTTFIAADDPTKTPRVKP